VSGRDNLGVSLKTAGVSKAEVARKVDEAAKVLELEPFLDRRPRELSGGQRQRVAIGRCIVRDPTAFLFDEPLSNLDAALRVEMRYEIAKLHRALGATMIYVTHDQVEAMTLADRIVVLNEGEISQVGTPRELYRRPENLFVAQFIGSPRMNILACTAEDGRFRLEGGGSGEFEGSGTPARLGIRPEHISVCAPGEGECAGEIDVVEYLGADTFLVVDCAGLGPLTVRAPGDTHFTPGAKVGLAFEADKRHFFDQSGRRLDP